MVHAAKRVEVVSKPDHVYVTTQKLYMVDYNVSHQMVVVIEEQTILFHVYVTHRHAQVIVSITIYLD